MANNSANNPYRKIFNEGGSDPYSWAHTNTPESENIPSAKWRPSVVRAVSEVQKGSLIVDTNKRARPELPKGDD